MTIDLSSITYSVYAALPDGSSIDLTDVCENIGWEENESEFSARLNLTMRDVEYGGKRLAAIIPLCTRLYVHASCPTLTDEVWRGTVWEWEHSDIPGDPIVLTGYDMLYQLQKSKDNQYFAKGKKTQAVIESICKKWEIPIGEYKGPDVKHDKLLYKAKKISEIFKEILSDAEDKGAVKCFVRANKGKMDVLPYGTNEEAFSFSVNENLISTSDKYSMTDLVTKVLIVGKGSNKGNPKVVATVTGKTEYGILQEIQTKSSGSLADAKKAAQKLLKEKGDPKRTIKLEAPDVPFIRKGDQIYVSAYSIEGYFKVLGISHNATGMSMSMEVKPLGEG